jgi:hypothetical protein
MDNGLGIAIVCFVSTCLLGIVAYTVRETCSKKPIEETMLYDSLPPIPEEEV